jgi:hypothetical protein
MPPPPPNPAAGTCIPPAVGQRFYGGGYISGTNADGILPYPLAGVTAEVCAKSCAAAMGCKTYVHSETSCWRCTLQQFLDACKNDRFDHKESQPHTI